MDTEVSASDGRYLAAALGERIDHPCSGECRAPEAQFPERTVYSTASR